MFKNSYSQGGAIIPDILLSLIKSRNLKITKFSPSARSAGRIQPL